MEKTWRTEINSKPKLWNVDFKEIWQYRSLIWVLFKRNYSLQYKQTVLGPFWMIFNVIFNTGVFTLVFGYVGKMSSDGVPYFLFCLSGTVVWNLFSSCFYGNTRVLIENTYLFGKVFFSPADCSAFKPAVLPCQRFASVSGMRHRVGRVSDPG